MDLAEAVAEGLERLSAAGRVEVRDNGASLAALEDFRYELRQQGDALLLHLWSAERSLVRRVLRIDEVEPGRLALDVACFSRSRPDRLEFVSAPAGRAPGRILREQFCARFRDLLARQFPDADIASLTAAADLKHSLSGNYARGIVRDASAAWAVLGAAPGESAATYDGLLTFGLLWLDRARELARGKSIAGLRLFCPEGAGRVAAHRLKALSNPASSRYTNTISKTGARGAWIRSTPAISTPGSGLAAKWTRSWRRRAPRSRKSAASRPHPLPRT